MLALIATALVATAPAMASFANVAAAEFDLAARDDPCSQWCDPWFNITDAELACDFLVNSTSTFQTCAGCSVAHGGSVDEWAADYYSGDYAYYSDCPACYDVTVTGIDFSSVSSYYNNVVSPSASVASSTAHASGTASSSVKLALASGSAASSAKTSTASQAFDNTGIKASSAAKSGPVTLAVLAASAAFACFLV